MYLVTILVIALMIATVAVLGVGITSMAKGGDSARHHGVQLMFARSCFRQPRYF